MTTEKRDIFSYRIRKKRQPVDHVCPPKVIFTYDNQSCWCRSQLREKYPDNKVHGANMRPTWVLSAPDGPHVGHVNNAFRVDGVEGLVPCAVMLFIIFRTDFQNRIMYHISGGRTFLLWYPTLNKTFLSSYLAGVDAAKSLWHLNKYTNTNVIRRI